MSNQFAATVIKVRCSDCTAPNGEVVGEGLIPRDTSGVPVGPIPPALSSGRPGAAEGLTRGAAAGLAAQPATREAAGRLTTPSYAVNPEGSRVKLGHYRVAGGRSRRRAPLGGRPRRVAGQEVTSMNAAWPSEVLYCSARG